MIREDPTVVFFFVHITSSLLNSTRFWFFKLQIQNQLKTIFAEQDELADFWDQMDENDLLHGADH